MSIKNPHELLIAATALPAAIESKLPKGAPKISEMLVNAANKADSMLKLPNFIVALPDLPTLPTPGAVTPAAARYVQAAEVRRAAAPAPAPAKRGLVKFVYE